MAQDAGQESDLELLESYLDGELSSSEMEAVEARLDSDAALAGMLRDLRTEQGMRDAYFAAIEASDGDVERAVSKAYARVERGKWRWNLVRRAASMSAVAAGLAVAFMVGRSGRVEEKTPTGVASSAVATTAYQVAIRDEEGNLVATQRFESLEEAREFAEDLKRWEELQRQLAAGQVMVRSARF